MRKSPELLIPAGSLEVLKTAVHFGADAVYIGGEAYGLRANARNFSMEDMKAGIHYAHQHGVSVHVTVNVLAHSPELPGIEQYLKELAALGEDAPDALIIADPGVFLMAKRLCPMCELHVSTQANSLNYADFQFWQSMGAKRVVCARELSLAEIREIREKTPQDLQIEAFIHGAMCISYSGRCLLSNWFTGRDSNHGDCTNPCRWRYAVMEETRPGEYLPVMENERGTFIFNSRDLCMIDHIPEMVDAGIDSFKVEGRMRTALYVATVARAYRRAIDTYLESAEAYQQILPWCREEIRKCTYRPFTTGFYFGKPGADSMVYENNVYRHDAVYLGLIDAVDEAGRAKFMQRNKFLVGDSIEIMKPDGRDVAARVTGLFTEDGTAVDGAPHPQQILWMTVESDDPSYEGLKVGDLFRKNPENAGRDAARVSG
ncbi:MAG: U32 family peptidase [Lachnospiraceae bacterium]|nr:U32 family peptidase [Lachnospiraceae bacterium]